MTVAEATLYGALIGGGAVLAAGIAAIGASMLIERRRNRGEARRRRDAAVAELLTATVDLITGIQVIRAAYEGRSGWRWHLRKVVIVFAAVCAAFASAGEISLRVLLDWRHAGSLIDRLLAEDRQLDEAQRTTALDVTAIVTTRSARFFAAVATVTIGGTDGGLSESANRLAGAVGGLLEAMGGKRGQYQQARTSAERALAEFRRMADRRC